MPTKKKIVTYAIDELAPEVQKKVLDSLRYGFFDDADAHALTEEFETILEEKGIAGAKANWSLSSCQGDGVCFTGRVNIPTVIEINKLSPQFDPLVPIYHQDSLSARILNASSRYCHWNSMAVEVELHDDRMELLPRNLVQQLRYYEEEKAVVMERYRQQWYLVKERNLKPIRDYEKLVKDFEKRESKGPHEWSPRIRHPGYKPVPLTEPYPPEPVYPMPAHLQAAVDEAEVRWKEIETLTNEFQGWLEQWVKDVSRELEKLGYAEIEYRQSDEWIIESFMANDRQFLKDGVEFRG